MALALYEPGLGYYSRSHRMFGTLPSSGSDFVTAPEMSPLFGAALAAQVAQALEATGTDEVWEFGAGSGALAQQLLQALGPKVRRYRIVDLSGALRARQQERLAAHAGRVEWLDRLPQAASAWPTCAASARPNSGDISGAVTKSLPDPGSMPKVRRPAA
jgi:SAM-dependent MidA family methyltransferase